ncbi:hypothetical protein ZIOFF_060389 [Zingiber officinale]|uniref:Uncharacterized protein n=1 Tax=Zingiber officinale TaxID=94328 RepID=A0A8J5KC36_ZINOF|nr:hypothetical protein ZIOFF_060389 [Zingiber officinale]
MVSKRQNEARKRLEETNPRPEDATTSIPKAEKGMKSRNTKRRKEGGFKKKSGTSAIRKHPLRVPGMRPGESCYICKSTSHITKLCPEKAVWERKKESIDTRFEELSLDISIHDGSATILVLS